MWNIGSTPSATSLARISWPVWLCACSMFDSKFEWVSIAAFGEPPVPAVKISTARSSGVRSTIGTGSPPKSDSKGTASSRPEPSGAKKCVDAQRVA